MSLASMMRGVLKNRVTSLPLFLGRALRSGFPSPSPSPSPSLSLTKPFQRFLSSYDDPDYESDDYSSGVEELCTLHAEAMLEDDGNDNCNGIKPEKVVIFRHRFCPLAEKVAVFLEYYKVPYASVLVTPITKDEIKWSHHKSLPMFVVDDQYDQPILDSSEFINKLVKKFVDPDYDPNADEEEKQWREWVDNHVVHVVLANAYRTYSRALESFSYAAPDSKYPYAKACNNLFQRLKRMATMYAGAAERYCMAMKLMNEHNISDERTALHEAGKQWVDALKQQRYIGGRSKPSLADLAFFAAIRIAVVTDYDLGVELMRAQPGLYTWNYLFDTMPLNIFGGTSHFMTNGTTPYWNLSIVFLEYYKVPYASVLVTPISKDEIKWSHHKSLPMFVVDDQYDQPILDSSEFINKLVKKFVDPDYDPNTDEEEKQWREWVDNHVVHVVLANAYRTYSRSLESFSYAAPDSKYMYAKACNNLFQRLKRMATLYAGAAERYYMAMKLMKEHNIPDERTALHEAGKQWIDALKQQRFLGDAGNLL